VLPRSVSRSRPREVLGEDFRRMHAGALEQPGDTHKGTAVLVLGRGVHDDVRRAVVETGAEIAPEAGVG
jgi:hypothetical protein